jgi:hypothetical protein
MNSSTQLLELMDSGAFFQYEVCHMQTFSVTCGNFVKRSELNIIFCCQSPSVSQKFLLYAIGWLDKAGLVDGVIVAL